MSKYIYDVTWSVDVSYEFEADTPEEADEKFHEFLVDNIDFFEDENIEGYEIETTRRRDA